MWFRLVAPHIIHRPEEEIDMTSESIFACTMVIIVPFHLFPTPIYHSKNVSLLVLVFNSDNQTECRGTALYKRDCVVVTKMTISSEVIYTIFMLLLSVSVKKLRTPHKVFRETSVDVVKKFHFHENHFGHTLLAQCGCAESVICYQSVVLMVHPP